MSTRSQAIAAEARYVAHLYEVYPSQEKLARIEARLEALYDHALASNPPGWHRPRPTRCPCQECKAKREAN